MGKGFHAGGSSTGDGGSTVSNSRLSRNCCGSSPFAPSQARKSFDLPGGSAQAMGRLSLRASCSATWMAPSRPGQQSAQPAQSRSCRCLCSAFRSPWALRSHSPRTKIFRSAGRFRRSFTNNSTPPRAFGRPMVGRPSVMPAAVSLPPSTRKTGPGRISQHSTNVSPRFEPETHTFLPSANRRAIPITRAAESRSGNVQASPSHPTSSSSSETGETPSVRASSLRF